MKLAIRTFSAIFIVLTGTQAFCGSDEQSKNLESVLDKLERRLLDRESAPLTYAEKKSVEASDTTTGKGQAKTPTIEVKTNKEIEGQTPNAKSLSEIQRKIAEYDAQLEN